MSDLLRSICAFTNAGTSTTAGTRIDPCEKEVEGSAGDTMGGEISNDSSGTLKYVRVQYAGYEVFPGNELNGITFGGVGNGTVVDFIQVHNNQDDCVEFFGGTVDVKHLICTGAGDDNLDIDWGYQGRMQYVLVQQSNGVGDHVVESDNTNADAAVAYARRPWMPYHEFFSESLSKLVGAKPEEVVVMGSLTNNLHLLMVSFFRPEGKRTKILCEAKAFPSVQASQKVGSQRCKYEPTENSRPSHENAINVACLLSMPRFILMH